MSAPADRLKIALVHHGYGAAAGPGERVVRDLALALQSAGHQPHVLAAHRAPTCRTAQHGFPVLFNRRVSERVLQIRGFDGPLTHIPLVVRALLSGRFDVVQAFTPPDALAALLWRDLTGRPVVFTCTEILGRDRVADRRLRLWLLSRAVDHSDAVTVPSQEAAAAAARWLAIQPRLLEPSDAAGHERLYRELLQRAH